jgi:hypothetical protein
VNGSSGGRNNQGVCQCLANSRLRSGGSAPLFSNNPISYIPEKHSNDHVSHNGELIVRLAISIVLGGS